MTRAMTMTNHKMPKPGRAADALRASDQEMREMVEALPRSLRETLVEYTRAQTAYVLCSAERLGKGTFMEASIKQGYEAQRDEAWGRFLRELTGCLAQ